MNNYKMITTEKTCLLQEINAENEYEALKKFIELAKEFYEGNEIEEIPPSEYGFGGISVTLNDGTIENVVVEEIEGEVYTPEYYSLYLTNNNTIVLESDIIGDKHRRYDIAVVTSKNEATEVVEKFKNEGLTVKDFQPGMWNYNDFRFEFCKYEKMV